MECPYYKKPSNKVNILMIHKKDKTTCEINKSKKHKCPNKATFWIFTGDGEPRLSRSFMCVCDKHLPRAIKKAWKENNKNNQKKKAKRGKK